MSAAAVTTSNENGVQTWAERNQRWLSQRIAFWRDRIDSRDADAAARLEPPDESDRDFQPAATRLRTLFGLSVFECELTVVAAGVEIDAAFRASVAQAQETSPREVVRISYSLALSLLPQPHWDAISPTGPLRHWSLVDFDTSLGFAQARVRIDERVLHFLTGVTASDDHLAGIAEHDESAHDIAPRALTGRIAGDLSRAQRPLVILVNANSDPSRRRSGRALARAVFHGVGLQTLWVRPPSAATDSRDLAELARRIDREAVLSQAGVALAVSADPIHAENAVRLIDALQTPVIALGSPGPLDLADLTERTQLRFTVPAVEASMPRGMSPVHQRAGARALQQFHVDPALLEQAFASAADLSDETEVEERVWSALRESARGGLDALAQRIESRATFDDLVVPSSVNGQLREIAGQLRYRQQVYDEWGFGQRNTRGLGIAALFSGESGTGKTLAAEAIANEARLDVYRIDLASVVSKYIGETEKNLSRLFDAAEHSGAVLLFDEADALFGKRSEVKDSHDRYANIEVAYLLQRVEAYRGLAILTTNMKSALDRAFLRRIRFLVQFPFPDESARKEIWQRQIPSGAPVDRIDFTALARLQLSGGNIRSVVLNAAFHAAARHESIGQDALMLAARAELAKLERGFTSTAATT